MAMTNPQQAAANWAKGMSQATDKAKQGVMALTTSPTELAAQAVPRMVAGIQRAADEGRIASGLRSVSLSAWQKAYTDKAVPIMATRAQQAQPKVAAFMTQFLPFLQSNMQQLQSMPRGSLQDNINRAVFMMNANAQFKYNKQAVA